MPRAARIEIEIWFALDGSKLYMLAGNHRSDWVRNIDHTPRVTVRIAGRIMQGHGRRVEIGSREEERARVLVGTKYGEWRPGRTRTGWTWEALPMAVDLEENKEAENIEQQSIILFSAFYILCSVNCDASSNRSIRPNHLRPAIGAPVSRAAGAG